jgi:dTDP-4-amino-4,6-dideoxygalactose transaminase
MSSPDLTEAEREAVAAVLHTPNLSIGPQIKAFEDAFRTYTGMAHAIGVSSGTSGLHLCVRAAKISAGDFVLTTPFSFVASANVILFEHAVPIFVDVDPLSGNLAPEQLGAAVLDLNRGGSKAQKWLPRKGTLGGGSVKAILPVDVFGQPADMDPVMQIAKANGLKVIEDSCEALGGEYKGRKAGTLGHYGVFAFYPNKQITTGEGAIIVTDDAEASGLMRALRNQGRTPGDTWLQHTYLGYNYRLDEMSAALGCVQMSRIETLVAKRARVAGWYKERLAGLNGVEIPFIAPTTTRNSWFVYVVRFAEGINRDEVVRGLREQGIPSRPYFNPIHLQPYMVDRFGYQRGDYPVTEELGRHSLALPFSGVMREDQVDQVCKALHKVLNVNAG